MRNTSPLLRAHERVLVAVERFPWSALYRIGIGYSVVPVYSRLFSQHNSGWNLVLWFIGVLFTLRLVPAMLRRVLPFSQEVAAVWAERRVMAKRFDSYQWQKLFWFGVGLSAHAASSRHIGGIGAALTLFCLLGGGLGFVVWRQRIATDETWSRARG